MRVRDTRGVAAIEFAISASAFFLLLQLAIEVGWQSATQIALQHGAHDAIRFAITGNSRFLGVTGAPACGRSATIEWLATRSAPGLLVPNRLSMTTSNDDNPTQPGAANTPGQGGFAGSQSDTIIYTFTYRQPWVTPIGGAIIGGNAYTHTVSLLAQNEPFPTPACQ